VLARHRPSSSPIYRFSIFLQDTYFLAFTVSFQVVEAVVVDIVLVVAVVVVVVVTAVVAAVVIVVVVVVVSKP